MKGTILNILALCRKAGKLKLGFDPVSQSLGKDAKLVVFARDVSLNTKEKMTHRADQAGVRCLTLHYSSDEVFAVLGKRVAVAAVTDQGLADKAASLTDDYDEEELHI